MIRPWNDKLLFLNKFFFCPIVCRDPLCWTEHHHRNVDQLEKEKGGKLEAGKLTGVRNITPPWGRLRSFKTYLGKLYNELIRSNNETKNKGISFSSILKYCKVSFFVKIKSYNGIFLYILVSIENSTSKKSITKKLLLK